MKKIKRVIDCADTPDKTPNDVLALALERKIKVIVQIHQIVEAIENQSKSRESQIDTADPISSASSEIWADRGYLYYLDQKNSSWPSKTELLNSLNQLASANDYKLEDVRKSGDIYFEVLPDSLKLFIMQESLEEVEMDVFSRVVDPAEKDNWSGIVWFFGVKILVGLDWLFIFEKDHELLNQTTKPIKEKKLSAMDVDKSNYHLWFIEDYLDKNLSDEKVSFREAWEELRKNADKEKVEHPYQNQNSGFKFRRETKALLITEHYENSDKLASNEEKEADSNQKKLLKLDAFRKAFDRKRKRRNQLMQEHKE